MNNLKKVGFYFDKLSGMCHGDSKYCDLALQAYNACTKLEINNYEGIELLGTGYNIIRETNTVCVFRLINGKRIAYYFDLGLFYKYIYPYHTPESIFNSVYKENVDSLHPDDTIDETIPNFDDYVMDAQNDFPSSEALSFMALILKNLEYTIG